MELQLDRRVALASVHALLLKLDSSQLMQAVFRAWAQHLNALLAARHKAEVYAAAKRQRCLRCPDLSHL